MNPTQPPHPDDPVLTEAVARHLPRRSAPTGPVHDKATHEKMLRALTASLVLCQR